MCLIASVCLCVCAEQVIFDVSTVYNQFPWHLSEQVALDVSVFIPGRQVVTGQINFMEVRRGEARREGPRG